MKEYIDKVFSDLKNECITEKQAHKLVLDLLDVSGCYLNELIDKHEANKKKALENIKIMEGNDQLPWYDATFNNSLLFLWDLKDIRCRMGLDK